MPNELLNLGCLAGARGIGAIPHVDQYFGAWAMYEPQFNALREFAQTINVQLHLEQHGAVEAREAASIEARMPYEVVRGGVAIVEIRGTMMKHASSFSRGTSTAMVRRQLRAAAVDEEVAAIMLVIDSPGGTVAGMHDLARDIAAAAKQKPLHAYIEDMGCSAAFWAASQAGRVVAGEGAIVGSIGVFNVVHDLSAMAEQEGVLVHVVKFGAFKGAAVPGTKVTDEQLAEYQKLVDAYGDDFVTAVASGRKISKAEARALADGRVHKGKAAIELKLVDAIESFDEAMRQLTAAVSQGPSRAKGKAMSVENTGAAAAPAKTLQEMLAEQRTAIAAACPGADDEFINAQVGKGATPLQAAAAWGDKRVADAEARAKKAEEEKAALEKSGKAKGNQPVKQLAGESAAGEYAGDAAAEYNAKINALVEKGMPRMQAAARVAHEHPELREAMVAQANAGRKK